MRGRVAIGCLAALALAGCGGSGKSAYSSADVRAAYYKPADFGAQMTGSWVDPDFHSHSNYVPDGSLEICPLAQRAETPGGIVRNAIAPKAGQPVQQYIVNPKEPDDLRTPTITQGALVFGTGDIAGDGMDAAQSAMTKCPTSYSVHGGPAPILGTYSVSMRPFKLDGWSGVSQQIAHTFPIGIDNVYYEDLTHMIVQRANVILYVDVTHEKIIGERADSGTTAQTVLETVLKRLG
jgi:hypothetical protein